MTSDLKSLLLFGSAVMACPVPRLSQLLIRAFFLYSFGGELCHQFSRRKWLLILRLLFRSLLLSLSLAGLWTDALGNELSLHLHLGQIRLVARPWRLHPEVGVLVILKFPDGFLLFFLESL